MKKLSRLLLVTAAAALLGAGAKAYSTLRRTAEAEAALVQTRERLRELQGLSQLVDRYGHQKRVIEEKLHLIETLRDDAVIPDRLIEHLDASAPLGLQLERILVRSQLVEISGRAGSRDGLTAWGESLEETAARLSEFQAALEKNEQRLEQLARVLPDTPELERLEEELRALGAASGVRVTEVAAAEPRVHEFHAALPLELTVVGSHSALSDYLHRLRSLARLIHLEGIEANREAGTSRCRLRLEAFQYREHDPAVGPS